jgi:hypothetical protein
LFVAGWNTVYPLIAISGYLMLNAGLRPYLTSQRQMTGTENEGDALHKSTRRNLLIVGSGVLISLATFANISTVPMIGFLGIYTALVVLKWWDVGLVPIKRLIAQKSLISFSPIRGLLWIGVLLFIGLSSVWIVYYAVSGVTPFAILNTALGEHLTLDRPYLPWVYLHLYDLALFTGLPVVLMALVAIVRGLPLRRRFDLSTFDPLGVALAVTLLILVLSGTARGETGRVWMFFVPFVLILAARAITGRMSFLATITQAIVLLTLVAFLRTVGTELTPPPRQPMGGQANNEPLATPATFAGGFTLVGWRGTPGKEGIDLTLSWRADRQSSVPYYLSALIVDPDRKPIPPASNWQPFETRYPITCWQPGQIITETRHIPLSGHNLKSGDYWISLSAFEAHNGVEPKGVTVSQPGQPLANQIGLGPVRVP